MNVMGSPRFDGKWQRRAVGLAAAVLVTSGLSACDAPSNPKRDAYVKVTNQCAAPIAVLVGDAQDSYAAADGTSGMPVVKPGETQKLAESLLLPLSDVIYVWVVTPGAAQQSLPREVAVATLEHVVDEHGLSRYTVPIAGDLCP